MADFCKQCSTELFGEDYGDLANLIKEEDVNNGLGAAVICEGCGFILVNHLGECISEECNEGHNGRSTGSS